MNYTCSKYWTYITHINSLYSCMSKTTKVSNPKVLKCIIIFLTQEYKIDIKNVLLQIKNNANEAFKYEYFKYI